MERRHFLSGTGIVLSSQIAGCLNLSAGSEVSANTDDAPRAHLSMTVISEPQLPSQILRSVKDENLAPREARLFEKILDGGEDITWPRPPFPENRQLIYDGTIYSLSYEVTDQEPATSFEVRLGLVKGTEANSSTINYADLPAVDRQKLSDRSLDSLEDAGIVTGLIYSTREQNSSVLVPEPHYSVIDWENGTRAEWTITDTSETTVDKYRYSAERVASVAEYGQQMRARFAFDLGDLSNDQREIISNAISGENYTVEPEETPTTAFQSLTDRIQANEQVQALHEPSTTHWGGHYLINYDGELYWTDLGIRGDSLTTAVTN